MMHQLGGPLSRISNVVQELADFSTTNPAIGDRLLPNENRAKARAAMTGLPLEEYSLRTRLVKLESAVQEIRHLQYLIRRYKNAQGELDVKSFGVGILLQELAKAAQGQLVDLQVRIECESDLIIEADRELIRTALAEVVNNGCRECRERQVIEPRMALIGQWRDNRARIAIEDNGFPIEETLLPDVFAEDASTYRAVGKGSGLGLAIVKETILRHGGRCGLEENRTSEGARRPGVTFWADFAGRRSVDSVEDGSDV